MKVLQARLFSIYAIRVRETRNMIEIVQIHLLNFYFYFHERLELRILWIWIIHGILLHISINLGIQLGGETDAVGFGGGVHGGSIEVVEERGGASGS